MRGVENPRSDSEANPYYLVGSSIITVVDNPFPLIHTQRTKGLQGVKLAVE